MKINCSLFLIMFLPFYVMYFLLGQKLLPKVKAAKNGSAIFAISRETLEDKIKGGWAGQAIGVTYGGPTEFNFNGTMIQDYTPIPWHKNSLKETFTNNPGLYDDIYMDLTFVEVVERLGLEAPVDSFALAFARADFPLWHANQAARYNILQGILPPQSGHWLNNPHADCIDFQIEADFAGLMSPGMINSAAAICNKIGHIMNYGDGWYGGVYVAGMYALAFYSDDIDFITAEALKLIPRQSDFYQCIHDVIVGAKRCPDDWRSTWFEVQKKWSLDIGCPDGVFNAFDIDAKINAAYIVIGLLYGNGDFGKTIDISTRCGQDSDCNPASAGGILGTAIGYSNLPAKWKEPLAEIEKMNFLYTTFSLEDVYQISFKHALAMIEKNGGEIKNKKIIIPYQQPQPVQFEQSFAGHFPIEKRTDFRGPVLSEHCREFTFEFEGIGFVIMGKSFCDVTMPNSSHTNVGELFINGELIETVLLPTDFIRRRHELFWKYQLPKQKYEIKIRLKDPQAGCGLHIGDILIYDEAPGK